ncbi:MAG: hypothetical protein KGI84_03870 [Elusimicrobia bacterium]|nr:hypothetical protein [Elusimicrobiota bacterium]
MRDNKPPKGGLFVLGAAAAALLLCSCAGPSISVEKKLNSLIAAQNYSGADSYLDGVKHTQFGKKNAVLYYLDKGAVEHYGGWYAKSDRDLAAAEHRMEDLYTKSVTKMAGTLILNDNTMPFAGTPYDRVLEHILRSLNYSLRGDIDDALVESRKVELFLDNLNADAGKSDIYKDDAFARYLDALYYSDEGMNDDARISMDAAKKAYGWYAGDYNTPMPQFPPLGQDQITPDTGELVFIHYNGVAPRKISKTVQVAWGDALVALKKDRQEEDRDPRVGNALRAGLLGNAITVAYPEYVQDHFSIVSSDVLVDSRPAVDTQLAEDVSAIAFKSLKDNMPLIMTRAIARATVKFILAKTASDAAADYCDKKFGTGNLQDLSCRMLSRGAAFGLAAGTEAADTRCWTTLPSQIRIAREELPAGAHDVTVQFRDAAGGVVMSHVFKDVVIKPGKRTYLAFRTAL